MHLNFYAPIGEIFMPDHDTARLDDTILFLRLSFHFHTQKKLCITIRILMFLERND